MAANTVICQEWLESERGWGVRPDGASLHLTSSDLAEFVKEYNDSLPPEPPDEYSRPCGSPKVVTVDKATHSKVKKSKNGIRLLQSDYHKLDFK